MIDLDTARGQGGRPPPPPSPARPRPPGKQREILGKSKNGAICTKNKQKAFCDNFIATGCGAEAARKAGYATKSARVTASKLLTKANVQQYIGERLDEMSSARIATAAEVMEFLTKVMRGEIRDQFGLDASIADRLTAAKELLKRLDAADSGNTTLNKLDRLLYEFKVAVYNYGDDAEEGDDYE